jgi:hypothetical protein
MTADSRQTEQLPELPTFLEPPSKRVPPESLRQQVLAQSGPGGQAQSTGGRSDWLRPLLAAAVVAAVVVGGAIALTPDRSDPSHEPPSESGAAAQPGAEQDRGTGAVAAEAVIPLDLGPANATEVSAVLASCGALFGFDPQAADVGYARQLGGLSGPLVVVVADTPAGDRYACDSVGNGAHLGGPSGKTPAPPNPAGPRDLVSTNFGGMQSAFDPETGTMEYWEGSDLFAAGNQVASVQKRVGTAADPGPWRTSPVHDGFVYVAAWWDDNEYTPSTGEVRVEYRAFDVDGELIEDSVILDHLVSNGADSQGGVHGFADN